MQNGDGLKARREINFKADWRRRQRAALGLFQKEKANSLEQAVLCFFFLSFFYAAILFQFIDKYKKSVLLLLPPSPGSNSVALSQFVVNSVSSLH